MNLLFESVIIKVENGENGIEPAIIVKTTTGQLYMITISNSKRFIISKYIDSTNPKNDKK